ncbi:MAG: universal stress protein [Desulfobacteraceae bacterium]|nr:universal stress protein [Desulfobacteraceae bacterium]
MKKIKKILVCIDLSQYSVMTLEYALELVKNKDTQMIVYNVINQRDLEGLEIISSYFSSKVVPEDYIRNLKKDRQEKLDQLIDENFSDEKPIINIKVDTGIPFECILKAVETEDADLVVMGNKGRGNLSRVLFGSVAEKVFRHSPVPVVSIRDKMKFKRGNTNGKK